MYRSDYDGLMAPDLPPTVTPQDSHIHRYLYNPIYRCPSDSPETSWSFAYIQELAGMSDEDLLSPSRAPMIYEVSDDGSTLEQRHYSSADGPHFSWVTYFDSHVARWSSPERPVLESVY